MADRVAVLKDGRIVQIGAPDEIYRRPVNAFVASFIGETNFIQGKLLSKDADGVEIETAAGKIRAGAAPEGVSVGEKVTLSVRPEAITLNPAVAGEGANEIAAVLEVSAYLGEVANHTARTESGGISLSFLELNGIKTEATNDEVAELGLAVASGSAGYDDILSWIKSHKTN